MLFRLLEQVSKAHGREQTLYKYVAAHTKRTKEASEGLKETAAIARLCDLTTKHLKGIVVDGPRLATLSQLEYNLVSNNEPITCRFGFLDGSVQTMDVDSVLTAGAVVKEMMTRVELQDYGSWSLYETIASGDTTQERILRHSDYIADVITRWEADADLHANASKAKNATKLHLRKRLFKDPQEIPRDPIEYSLLYSQAVRSVLMGELAVTEKLAIQLAALQAQVLFRDYSPGESKVYAFASS